MGLALAVLPGGTEVVVAQANGEGDSQWQTIDPTGHREDAERDIQTLATDFLTAQEEALADEPLPLSRRQRIAALLHRREDRLDDLDQ